jgi:hypothetical protein
MVVDDIDSEHTGLRKEFGQPGCRLSGAAAGFEYAWRGWERVAADELYFLGPNRACLGVESANHGFVGHLLGLGIEIGHGILPRAPKAAMG